MRGFVSAALTAGLLLAVLPARASLDISDEDLIQSVVADIPTLDQRFSTVETTRAALAENQASLEKSLVALESPLPDEPPPVEETAESAEAQVAELAKLHSALLEAYRNRKKELDAASSLLDARERLLNDGIEKHRLLEKTAADLQPRLGELSRRLQGGRIPTEKLGTDGQPLDVAGASARSEKIVTEGGAVRAGWEAELGRVSAERERLTGAGHHDADTAARYQRAATAATFFETAVRLQTTEREGHEKLDPGVLITRMAPMIEDWRYEQELYLAARKGARESESARQQIADERRGLTPPSEDASAEGEGHLELRAARRQLAHSDALVEYHGERQRLFQRELELARQQREALVRLGEQTQPYVQESAKLRAALLAAQRHKEAGQLESYPAEPTTSGLWGNLRGVAVAEAGRRENFAALEANLADGEPARLIAGDLEQAKKENALLRAAYDEEVMFAELMDEIDGHSNEELVGLLAADGEISERIAAAEAEIQASATTVQQAQVNIAEVRRTIQSVENPFTRLAVTQLADRAESIRDEIKDLSEDRLLPEDRSQVVAPRLLRASQPSAEPIDGEDRVAAEVARQQARLEQELVLANDLLGYLTALTTAIVKMGEAAAKLDEAAQAHAKRLSELVFQEKRRYACARELDARLKSGRLARRQAPRGLRNWVTRARIETAKSRRSEFTRSHGRLRERWTADLQRLETIAAWKPWAEIRSGTADAKAALIGQPVAHLSLARAVLSSLPEYQQKGLQYQADARLADSTGLGMRLLMAFTDAEEEQRFEGPMRAFHIELVDSDRRTDAYERARSGFEELLRVSAQELQDLESAPAALREAEALRLRDYQVARRLAAIAARPDEKARIETEYRAKYGAELPLPADDRGWDQRFWADHLFAAETRLVGHRLWIAELERRLSKIGEAELGLYSSFMAEVKSASEAEKKRARGLQQRIGELLDDYRGFLRRNALEALLEILAIVLVASVAMFAIRRLTMRAEKRFRTEDGGDPTERQRRLQTINRVGSAAAGVAIWVVAGIYILAKLGLDVTPIVASASVVGLAVAFGAQTLIRDFFAGFFILLENQYTIGDIVDVGGTAGTVERISLRITTLRDLEGVVHYIPNGTVNRVSNKTQGWSRVVLEVGVSYRENVDRVREVLEDVLQKMHKDFPWSLHIVEPPTVAGVEAFGESSVKVRLLIKTRPGKQWDTAREVRRRIKQRFDQEGIEIPLPQRVVHHVQVAEHGLKLDEKEAGGGATEAGGKRMADS
jgi:small conductance mechanosensitive channel